MLREFPPVVVAETCYRVVVVVVMVMGGLMICTLMIPDPGLLNKAYVQQGMCNLHLSGLLLPYRLLPQSNLVYDCP